MIVLGIDPGTAALGYGSLDNFDQMYKTAVDDIKAWLAGAPKNVMAD